MPSRIGPPDYLSGRVEDDGDLLFLSDGSGRMHSSIHKNNQHDIQEVEFVIGIEEEEEEGSTSSTTRR